MIAWTEDELDRIGDAEELKIASARPDGSMRPSVTIWVVRVGSDLYVRSAYGSDNPWFRRAKVSGVGRVRAGGLERDVTFAEPAAGVHSDLDAAYHAKYDRYGPRSSARSSVRRPRPSPSGCSRGVRPPIRDDPCQHVLRSSIDCVVWNEHARGDEGQRPTSGPEARRAVCAGVHRVARCIRPTTGCLVCMAFRWPRSWPG